MNSNKNFFHFLRGTEIESDLEELVDEDTREALKNVIKQNFTLDELRTSIESNHDLTEAQKKIMFKFWKAHG